MTIINKKSILVGFVVMCPECSGENDVTINDLGTTDFPCQYSHCDKEFEIPSSDNITSVI